MLVAISGDLLAPGGVGSHCPVTAAASGGIGVPRGSSWIVALAARKAGKAEVQASAG